MPITFNGILREAGFSLADVRLLRHKDRRADKGKSPYELWRDTRPLFDTYQSIQTVKNQSRLDARFWASFVGTLTDETLFVGIYAVGPPRLLDVDTPKPHTDGIDLAGICNVYALSLEDRLSDLGGRLIIDWGDGERAWIQRADNRDKVALELRARFEEPDFPGFMCFIESLSRLERPASRPVGHCSAASLRRLSTDVPADAGKVRRFGDWRGWVLAAVARIRPDRPRWKHRAHES
jgi:hypothetical protein